MTVSATEHTPTTALVIATGHPTEFERTGGHDCMPMSPLVDRPFIQHVVECLVARGITNIDFLLCQEPERIEHLLGDGQRWGAKFYYHLARNPLRPYNALSWLDLGTEGAPLLLVQADRLEPSRWSDDQPAGTEPTVYCWQDLDGKTHWSGAAWLVQKHLKKLAACDDGEQFDDCVMELASAGTVVTTQRPLLAGDFRELLESQERVLNREFPELIRFGGEAADRIWIQRNVRLHPKARLIAPVYIAPNCQIDPHVELGPNVVVSAGCMIDSKCNISNSIILPDSYVGEGLEIDHSVVEKQTLFNLKHNVLVSIADDFIMGNLRSAGLGQMAATFATRVLAYLLATLFFPVMLITMLVMKFSRPGSVVRCEEIVRLPSSGDGSRLARCSIWRFGRDASEKPETMWQHFLFHFLPGLTSIAQGYLNFVGVEPRSIDETQDLADEWRELYLSSKAGIITEALVQYGTTASRAESDSAEAFYAAMYKPSTDVRLFFGYFWTLFFGPRVQGSGPDALDYEADEDFADEFDPAAATAEEVADEELVAASG